MNEFLQDRHGKHKPSILGLREYVFTGRSALLIFLTISWTLMSANGSEASHSADKHGAVF